MDGAWDSIRDLASSPPVLVIATLICAVVAAILITRLLRSIWARIVRRTETVWDDELSDRLGGPASALIALQLFRIPLAWVPLEASHEATIVEAIGVFTVLSVIWAAFRAIDVIRKLLEHRPWAIDRPASRSLLRLGGRFSKAAVLAMGSLVALSQMGVSVASLIAGLGIGGLVIALAAQKTVENVFGAVSIGIDQPMREGDFVKIYDFVGTVEQIGLRSTRIRTLDRTVITIPNGELANQRIESYTARDRIRLACILGLDRRTTAAQVRTVLESLREILRAHPKIWPDAVVVRFQQLAPSSLDVEVMAWFQTPDWGEFQGIREQLLIEFMAAIEAAGTSLAYPTRTVNVASAA